MDTDKIEGIEQLLGLVQNEPVLALNTPEPLVISPPSKVYSVRDLCVEAHEVALEKELHQESVYRFVRGLHSSFQRYKSMSTEQLMEFFPGFDTLTAEKMRQRNLEDERYTHSMDFLERLYDALRYFIFDKSQVESLWESGSMSLELPVQILYRGRDATATLKAATPIGTRVDIMEGEPSAEPSALYEMTGVPDVVAENNHDCGACLAHNYRKIGGIITEGKMEEYPFLFTGHAN